MNLAIPLAALTALATTLGGFLAVRSRDRLHLTLGLAAGLLLGLLSFDLLPEIFEINKSTFGAVPVVSIAFVGGFLLLHFIEQFSGSHEPLESEYGPDHGHRANIAGTLGAVAMGGHVFLDGVALGLAFQVSNSLGIAVFIAVLAHALSDGITTVSFLIKSGRWTRRVTYLLSADAVLRISGAALGTYISISLPYLGIYLAIFSGFIIYLATSHILPEAHSRHPSRLTMLATVVGVLIMWAVVGFIGTL
ncbi:MAG: ZIP family metal transporter [Actinobacteria bacterium]|nr:ZIP family metal transporter [Actinomycetota bacterium]